MFIELQSADPTERAIAQRVVTILNNPRWTRNERVRLVRQAQRELVRHRARSAQQAPARGA